MTLKLRLDAGATPGSEGASVAAIYDTSGYLRHAQQTTAGSQGTLSLRAVAGLPGVLLDGADDYYLLQGQTLHYLSSTAMAGFCVFRPLAVATSSGTPYLNDALLTDAGGFWGLFLSSSGPTAYAYWYDGADKNASRTYVIGDVIVLSWYVTGGNINCSVNGGSYATTAAGALSNLTNQPRLGLSYSGSHYFRGYLAELHLNDAYPSDWATQYSTLLNKYSVTRGSWIEQRRARLAQEVRLWRRARATVTVKVPLAQGLGLALGSVVPIAAPLVPSPHSGGAGYQSWKAWAGTLIGYEVDPGPEGIGVVLALRDARPIRCPFWYVPGGVIGGGATVGHGIPRIMSGQTWTHARTSPAWVDGADGVVRPVAVNAEKWDATGHLFEGYSQNVILNSSAAEGLASWTTTGSVTNDTGDLLFDPGETPQSFKLTADNPLVTGAILEQTTASVGAYATDKFILSIDHKDDSSQALCWTLQRSSDSQWFVNSTGLWNASEGTGTNFLATSATKTRSRSNVIDIGTGNPCTLKLRIKAVVNAAQVNHVYHVQIEERRWVTSRMLTRGVIFERQADSLTITNNTGVELWPTGHGTAFFRYEPRFATADVAGLYYSIFRLYFDASNEWRLYYDGTAGAFKFLSKATTGGSFEATKTVTLAPGTPVDLAVRFCSSAGELGLSPYTVSVFADGLKGTDAVPSALPTPTATANFELGCGNSVPCEGALSAVAFRHDVLTDNEILAGD